MANKLFSSIFVLLSMTTVYANECATSDTMLDDIVFYTSFNDPTWEQGHFPKTPVLPPSVSLDDHTLYFNTPCDGCTLKVVDSNDVVVYTTVISTGATFLALPSTLSGEYELQIIRGNYCFWGVIEL